MINNVFVKRETKRRESNIDVSDFFFKSTIYYMVHVGRPW